MTEQEMLNAGGKVLGYVGLQSRAVIEIEGKVYEKAIHFDDGYSHEDMYLRIGQDAEDLRKMLV